MASNCCGRFMSRYCPSRRSQFNLHAPMFGDPGKGRGPFFKGFESKALIQRFGPWVLDGDIQHGVRLAFRTTAIQKVPEQLGTDPVTPPLGSYSQVGEVVLVRRR